MATPYFPVNMSIMGAVRHFYEIGEEAIDVNGAVITSAPMNHPQGSMAYRIEADGGILVQVGRSIAPQGPVIDSDAENPETLLFAVARGLGEGEWSEERLSVYLRRLDERFGPTARRWTLPAPLAGIAGAVLLGSPWFARRVVLDRLFLHRVTAGRSGP